MADTSAPRIRVLICDDHPIVRQGLQTFLDLQEDMEVVGEASDGEEAIAKARAFAPDAVTDAGGCRTSGAG